MTETTWTQEELGLDDFYIEGLTDHETESPEVTTEVNTDFAEAKQETARARQYRKKVSRGLANLWRPMLASPDTINDATTILYHGPDFARAVGELADRDAKARRIIDFASEGVDNPYLSVVVTGIPMMMQLIRNHEEKLTVKKREIKIPFTKIGFGLKVGIKLGRLRNLTNEPSAITKHVLSNPALVDVLKKQGIQIAWPNDTASANGTGRARRFGRSSQS